MPSSFTAVKETLDYMDDSAIRKTPRNLVALLQCYANRGDSRGAREALAEWEEKGGKADEVSVSFAPLLVSSTCCCLHNRYLPMWIHSNVYVY